MEQEVRHGEKAVGGLHRDFASCRREDRAWYLVQKIGACRVSNRAIEKSIVERLRSVPTFSGSINNLKIGLVRENSSVADGASIYSIGDLYVVVVSPHRFPNVAAEEAAANERVRSHLSGRLASLIIDLVISDTLPDGRSFAVFPRGTPLSNNRVRFALQKRRAKPAILNWLRDVAAYAQQPNRIAQIEFEKSLAALNDVSSLAEEIRGAAKIGLAQLSNPRFCLMHGDLWKGNILFASDRSLKIIDWRGSRVDGYGFFDLARFAHSFGVRGLELEAEISAHASAMNIPAGDVLTYVLAGCGHVLRHLEEFPLPHFVKMVENLWATLKSV